MFCTVESLALVSDMICDWLADTVDISCCTELCVKFWVTKFDELVVFVVLFVFVLNKLTMSFRADPTASSVAEIF